MSRDVYVPFTCVSRDHCGENHTVSEDNLGSLCFLDFRSIFFIRFNSLLCYIEMKQIPIQTNV